MFINNNFLRVFFASSPSSNKKSTADAQLRDKTGATVARQLQGTAQQGVATIQPKGGVVVTSTKSAKDNPESAYTSDEQEKMGDIRLMEEILPILLQIPEENEIMHTQAADLFLKGSKCLQESFAKNKVVTIKQAVEFSQIYLQEARLLKRMQAVAPTAQQREEEEKNILKDQPVILKTIKNLIPREGLLRDRLFASTKEYRRMEDDFSSSFIRDLNERFKEYTAKFYGSKDQGEPFDEDTTRVSKVSYFLKQKYREARTLQNMKYSV